jgi:hypothetical protein
MRQKQSLSESRDKGVENDQKPLTKAGAKKAMARFESLARQLLAVTRDRLRDEQVRYEKRKHRRKLIK